MGTENSYDCIVLGGGPAGSTTATILADHGHRTLLLERSRFPRHHIGESLMPQTYDIFARLGVLDKLKASDCPRKASVQFVSANGKESHPFYFTERDPHERSTTWQVRRDEFDQMMLDNARKHGVEVREGVRAKSVLFDGARAVGVAAATDTTNVDITAKIVIDATGQSSIIAKQLDLWRPDPDLRNGSIYGYYQGARRGHGRDAGATIIVHTPDRKGWFWFVPLREGLTSIGLVAPPAYLFAGRGDDPLATFEEEIGNCPWMASRLEGAERVDRVYVTSDFSYRARRMAGDGWVLVGDAFCFLDPIYSSGVMLALKSGEMAADAIHDALLSNDVSGERLGSFAADLMTGVQYIRQLVYAFYDPGFSFGAFVRAHPKYQDHIVRILIGDVFNHDVGEVFEVMRDWVKLPAPIKLEGSVSAT